MILRYTLFLLLLPVSAFARDAGVPSTPAPTQSVSYQMLTGSGIELSDDANGVTFNTNGSEVVFGHASGEPNLPSAWVTLVLPENTDLSTVSPRLSNEEIEQVSLTQEVRPVPLQRATVALEADGGTIFSEEVIVPEGVDEVTGQNTAIYSADAYWPESWLSEYETLMEGSFPVVRVLVNLAKINPNPDGANSGKPRIEMLRFAILHVDFEVLEGSDEASDGGIQTEPPTEWLVYNVDNGQGLTAPSTDGLPGYLIVTSSDIYSDASAEATLTKNAIDNFKAHKEARGFNVVIQTEEAWLTVPDRGGQEAADDLRAWLAANYQTENWKYVLIIGKPIGDSYMPMKRVWPSETGHQWWAELPQFSGFYMHTDYYFAELSGNWDMDGDGKAGEFGHYSTPVEPYTKTGDFGTSPEGEHGIDRDHEVIVGRIPFYPGVSTAHDDLVGILNKTIAYQSALDTEIDWRKQVLLMTEHPNQHFFGEQIRNQVLSQANDVDSYRVYNADCLTPTDTCSPAITEPNYQLDTECNYNTATSRWAQETPGVVSWFAHGGPTGAIGIFNINNIPSLDEDNGNVVREINDTPAFTFQASCLTARPTHSNNLAYELLKKGGIATIGATHVAYGPYTEVPMANSGSLIGMAYEYIKSLVVERMPAGDALYDVKKRIPIQNHFWHYWVNMTLFNLYGDPEVGLYDHQIQYAFEVAPLASQQLEVGIPFSLVFEITTDAPSYEVAFSEIPDWLNFDSETLLLSGTPSESDIGQHPVSVLVGTGADSVHQSFVLSVERTNQPPQYEGELELYIPITNAPFRLSLPIVDPEHDRVSIHYEYDRPPDWVDLEINRHDNSGVSEIAEMDNSREVFELVFYTMQEVVGSHEVILYVSDGKTEVEFTLLVHVCGSGSDNDVCADFFDPCIDAPCLNGGTCVSEIEEGYACVCADGFEGQNCETAIEVADAGVQAVDAGMEALQDAGQNENAVDAGTSPTAAIDAGHTSMIELDSGAPVSSENDAGTLTVPVTDAGSALETTDAGDLIQIPNADSGNNSTTPNDAHKDDDTDETEVEDAGCGCSAHHQNKSRAGYLVLLALLGLKRRRQKDLRRF